MAARLPEADRIDVAHDVDPGDIRWGALLLAAGRSLSLSGARGGLRQLALDLALGLLARGAALLAGMWAWSSWAWWVAAALPVFALAAADVFLLSIALAAVGGFRASAPPRGAKPSRAGESRLAAVA